MLNIIAISDYKSLINITLFNNCINKISQFSPLSIFKEHHSSTLCWSFPGDLQEVPAALPSSFLRPLVQPQHERLAHAGGLRATQQIGPDGLLAGRRYPGSHRQPQRPTLHRSPLRASPWRRRDVHTQILHLQLTGEAAASVPGQLVLQLQTGANTVLWLAFL